jgi:hypothetical protein
MERFVATLLADRTKDYCSIVERAQTANKLIQQGRDFAKPEDGRDFNTGPPRG